MAKKNLSRFDAAEYERSSLEYILKKDSAPKDDNNYVSVEEAKRADAVFESQSNRNITRVLFISQDESLLNPTQQSLDGYTNLADLFHEVHILILRQGIPAKNPVLRLAPNMWLYTAAHKDWWGTAFVGKNLVLNQLVFADGFRPDIIVARDPYESAALAIHLGRKYERPVQLHVLEDYTTKEFLAKNRHNRWRRYMPRFTIARIPSIRTSTKVLQDFLIKRFPEADIDVLPRFNNYEGVRTAPSTLDLRAKYKSFIFIILYVGTFKHDSFLYRVIDAARFGLKNPRIGLVAVGDGPAKKEFEERAKILGVREQVVFEEGVKDDVQYMKSANVLVIPDTTPESEEIVLRAAAAGIPMILARTPMREDIFTDGESVLMCAPDNIDEYSLKLNILMNDLPLRKHIAENAQQIIMTKFHEDPGQYKAAYRESIEEVLFLGMDDEVVVDNPE